MKQMKFILVALMTVMLSVSVTSCMKGDDNPIQNLSVIAKLDSYTGSFTMIDGMKIVPTDVTATMLLTPGMYIVNGQYNINEVSNNTISLTLTSTPSNIDGPSLTDLAPTSNAPMCYLTYGGTNGYNPSLFDKNTLILPLMYWMKDVSNQTDLDAELKKHSFVISYNEIKDGDTELVLNLSHVITEETAQDRNASTVTYRSYDLSSVIYTFKSKGNTLKKITIKAKVNSGKNNLENAEDSKYEIDYSKIKD